VRFFLPHTPSTTTAQQKRLVMVGGKPRFFRSGRAKSAIGTLEALLIPHRPETPVESPCRLVIEYTFPWRKSETKRNIAKGWVWHTSRPDCSNLVKAIEDLLSVHRFMKDDAGVAELIVRKKWGDEPGIWIELEELAV